MAKQVWSGQLSDDAVRAKSYLYCLRATLAALFVADQKRPAPVEFATLLDYLPVKLQPLIGDLIDYKSESGEKQKMQRLEAVDVFLENEIAQEHPDDLTRISDILGADRILNDLFINTVRSVDKKEIGARLMRKSDFTLDRVRQPELLLFEAVAGSRAYGTHTPQSDEDLRGIFAAPTSFLTAFEDVNQVQDEKGDEVYYELGRFIELLSKSNPNALEMLYLPEDCVRYRHSVMDLINPTIFLTKKCEMSFAGYALGQVKKARGLNKKNRKS